MVLSNKVLIPLTVAAVSLPAVAQTGSPAADAHGHLG